MSLGPVFPRPSPNHGARPPGTVVDTIVLHADASPRTTSTLNWCRNPEAKVSYHFLIGRLGHVYELVATNRRAWHAGVSSYRGIPDVNDYSIGVCFSNDQKGEPFTEEALEAGARLCGSLILRHPGIWLERITTHAEIALPKGRKVDPGPLFPFDWFIDRVRNHYL